MSGVVVDRGDGNRGDANWGDADRGDANRGSENRGGENRGDEEYLAELEELLLRLAEQQQSVVARLQALEAGGGRGGTDAAAEGEGPATADYDWRVLDADAARAAWERLIGWVEWLVSVFPVADVLPGCWFEHPVLVWELAALHLAFAEAYEVPDAPRGGALGWMEALQRAHGRWRMWDQHKCAGAGRHKSGHAQAVWAAGWAENARAWGVADTDARAASASLPGKDVDDEGVRPVEVGA